MQDTDPFDTYRQQFGGGSEDEDPFASYRARYTPDDGRPSLTERVMGGVKRLVSGVREGRRQVQLGVVDSFGRAAEGVTRLGNAVLPGQPLGDPTEIEDYYSRLSERTAPTTGAGTAGRGVGNIAGEGLQYIAGGGLVRRVAAPVLARVAPKAATALSAMRGGQVAKDALAAAPVDLMMSAVGPENSTAGALGEVLAKRAPGASAVLRRVAANPVTRLASEVATGIVGDVGIRGIGKLLTAPGRSVERAASRGFAEGVEPPRQTWVPEPRPTPEPPFLHEPRTVLLPEPGMELRPRPVPGEFETMARPGAIEPHPLDEPIVPRRTVDEPIGARVRVDVPEPMVRPPDFEIGPPGAPPSRPAPFAQGVTPKGGVRRVLSPADRASLEEQAQSGFPGHVVDTPPRLRMDEPRPVELGLEYDSGGILPEPIIEPRRAVDEMLSTGATDDKVLSDVVEDIPGIGRAAPQLPVRPARENLADVTASLSRDRVTAAAIRLANGRVFTGPIHVDAMVAAQDALAAADPQFVQLPEFESGFVTSNGRFVDREEASRIAEQAEQAQAPGRPSDRRRLVAQDLPELAARPSAQQPTDLFGAPVEPTVQQGDLLGTGGPQGIARATEDARATVSRLEGRIRSGDASVGELARYDEARSLLRREGGYGLDAEEVAARASGIAEPDDTRDLFEPRPRLEQVIPEPSSLDVPSLTEPVVSPVARSRGAVRRSEYRETYEPLDDNDLIDRWNKLQRGMGRMQGDIAVADMERPAIGRNNIGDKVAGTRKAHSYTTGRETQQNDRIAVVEDIMRERGIEPRVAEEPWRDVRPQDVMEENRPIVQGGRLAKLSDEELAAEVRATEKAWEAKRENPALNERMALLWAEATKPGRKIDMGADFGGFALPDFVQALGRAGAGAIVGAPIGAALADENRGQGAAIGAAVGASLGVASLRRGRVGTGAATDAPSRPNRTLGASRNRIAGPTDASVDPDEFVNVAKFALDPTGEGRLRSEVSRIVSGEGLAPKEVVTWDQTRAVARDLGLDPEKFQARTRGKDGRLSGPEMLATRNIVKQNIEAIETASRHLDQGVGSDGLPLSAERARSLTAAIDGMESQNDALLSRFIRERTQTGRDLNNLKILANATMDPVTWLMRAQRAFGSPLPDVARAEVRRLVNAGDKEGLAKFVVDLRPATTQEKLSTLWKAGLLTGPPTHMVNIMSTGAMGVLENVKDAPAALYDRLWSVVSGVETKAFNVADQARAAVRGARRGAREGRAALTGSLGLADMKKYDHFRQVNYDSPILDAYTKFVFRSLTAEDRVFRGFAIERSLAEQARVLARREGLGGDALNTRVAELIGNPTDEMALRAVEAGEVATFTNKGVLGGMAGAGKQRAKQMSPTAGAVLEVVAPFTGTPSNVVTRVAEYSPLGAVSTIPDVIKLFKAATKGVALPDVQRRVVERLGRSTVGTLPILAGYILAQHGRLSLGYPEAAGERGQWEVTGQQENAVLIGDKWLSLERVSPLGNLILLGGYIHQSATDPERTALSMVVEPTASIARTVSEQSFLEGTRRALETLSDPEQNAEATVEGLAGSMVPNIARRFARYVDPVVREKEGVGDALRGAVPGMSADLPARIDPLGEPVTRTKGFVHSVLDPLYAQDDLTKDDPVRGEIARLGVSFTRRQKVGDETAETFNSRLQIEGRELRRRMEGLIASEEYRLVPEQARAYAQENRVKETPDELATMVQRDMLEEVISGARREFTQYWKANPVPKGGGP